MNPVRDSEGIVRCDLTDTPATEILVMDAGDNVIDRGTPDQLEVFERMYGSAIKTGKFTLISMP